MMDQQDRRAGGGLGLAAVGDEALHVARAVLVAAGHAPGQRVEHDEFGPEWKDALDESLDNVRIEQRNDRIIFGEVQLTRPALVELAPGDLAVSVPGKAFGS